MKAKVNITIIDNNYKKCQELSEKLDGAMIIYGDASDSKVLLEEGIEHMDAFVALTNLDEENIMLSLYANQVSKAKRITKVNKIGFEGIMRSIPVGSVISPKYLTAEHIIQFVRDLENHNENEHESSVDMVYRLADNKVEALEFTVDEESKVINTPIMNLLLKSNLLICSILRKNRVLIPSGQDKIQAGDKVVIVTKERRLNRLEDILDIAKR